MVDISDAIGEFGWYQVIVLSIGNIIGILAPCIIFVTAFIFPEGLDHWCKQPEEFNYMNTTEWKRNAIPFDPSSSTYDQCQQYAISRGPKGDYHFNRHAIIKCQDWDYDHSQFWPSATEEWNLVCEEAWKVPFPQGLCVVGLLIGSIVNGYFADRYGRRPVITICAIGFTILQCVLGFIPNFWLFNTFRFLTGFTASNLFFVLTFIVEIMSVNKRYLSMLCFAVFWGFGFIFLAGITAVISNWKLQLFTMGAIHALITPLLRWFYESPRWLLSSGRFEEAEKTIRAIAKLNRTEGKTKLDVIIPELIKEYKEARKTGRPEARIIDLVNTKRMFKYTVTGVIFMILIFAVYYDVCLKTNIFPLSPYVNFVISGGIETLAGLVSLLMLRFCWRRLSMIILCFIPVAIYVGSIFFGHLNVWFIGFLFAVCRFCLALTNDIDFVYMGEIFPTSVRALGLGLVTFASQLGGTIQPFVAPYLSTNLGQPLFYAVCLLVCTIIPFCWRETLGDDLPDFVD